MLYRNYECGALESWLDESIPSFITSSAALAHHYSRVLLGWLRDVEGTGKLNRDQPLTIMETGCGTGRFTFHMVRALEELGEVLEPRSIRWSYVATDISPKRLRLIENRREFRPYIETKRLRAARYDLLAGGVPSWGTPANPTVVICNYVLDSLPCDCFHVQGGKLYETRIAVKGEGAKEGLGAMTWRFSHRPAAVPHYRDRILDGILEGWRRGGDPPTILFPCGAMYGLRNLELLARGPLLVLAADKTRPVTNGLDPGMPEIELHGKSHFSLPVDFNLLGEYAKAEGGEMLASSYGNEVIRTAAFLLGGDCGGYPETGLAFGDQFDRQNPTAGLYVTARLEEQAQHLTIHDYLAYLRMVHWDPHQWMSLFPLFFQQAASPPPELRPALVEALERMGQRWYPPGGSVDVAFLIGCTFLGIGEPVKARAEFARSIEEYGRKPAVVFQLGRAAFATGDARRGAALAREALNSDPHLGGFLQRLGVMPRGEEEARQIAQQMDWDAGLGDLE